MLQQILVWLLLGPPPGSAQVDVALPLLEMAHINSLSSCLADSVHIEDAEAVEQLREALHEALLEYASSQTLTLLWLSSYLNSPRSAGPQRA